MKNYRHKTMSVFFGYIGLAITLAIATCTSCTEEPDPLPPELIGEWQMYFLTPIYQDTLYSPYFLNFQEGGSGQEELTEYYLYPFTWTHDQESFTLTWVDGSQKTYGYDIDGDWMLLFYKTDIFKYRLVTYER